MKYLLDTCVVSELNHSDCCPVVRTRIAELDDKDLYLSVVTVGEISKGITLLEASRKQRKLLTWLESLQEYYRNRILPIDMNTSIRWGSLTANAQKKGIMVPASDGLIAATACQHELCIMTRNIQDFEHTGATLENPWIR